MKKLQEIRENSERLDELFNFGKTSDRKTHHVINGKTMKVVSSHFSKASAEADRTAKEMQFPDDIFHIVTDKDFKKFFKEELEKEETSKEAARTPRPTEKAQFPMDGRDHQVVRYSHTGEECVLECSSDFRTTNPPIRTVKHVMTGEPVGTIQRDHEKRGYQITHTASNHKSFVRDFSAARWVTLKHAVETIDRLHNEHVAQTKSIGESVETPLKTLKEYLTPKQRKEFSKHKMSPIVRKATDHFFGKDNDRVEEDVIGFVPPKSEPHKRIEAHIGRELSMGEYISGKTKDKYGRDAKLGKLIKDKQLQDEFASDPVRQGRKISTPKMSIHRGVEVAGQTNPEPDELHPNGHSWADLSCKNIEGGAYSESLPNEIKHGTVVVFGHDNDGKEIYRATLQPFYNHKNVSGTPNRIVRGKPTKDVIYSVNSEYGVVNPMFTNHAKDVAKRLSSPPTEGMYYISTKVYDDVGDGDTGMLHHDISPESLENLAKKIPDSAVIGYENHDLYREIAKHPKLPREQLERLMNHKHGVVNGFAWRNPNVTENDFMNLLDSEKHGVGKKYAIISGATEHPGMTMNVVKKAWGMRNKKTALSDRFFNHRTIANEALRSNSTTTEMLKTALRADAPRDDKENTRFIVYEHPNADEQILRHAMKHGDTRVKQWILENPNKNVTSKIVDEGIKDIENPEVLIAAAKHEKLSSKGIDTLFSHGISGARKYRDYGNRVTNAMDYALRTAKEKKLTNFTSDHIHKLVDYHDHEELMGKEHPFQGFGLDALKLPNADESHFEKANSNWDSDDRWSAAQIARKNPKISSSLADDLTESAPIIPKKEMGKFVVVHKDALGEPLSSHDNHLQALMAAMKKPNHIVLVNTERNENDT